MTVHEKASLITGASGAAKPAAVGMAVYTGTGVARRIHVGVTPNLSLIKWRNSAGFTNDFTWWDTAAGAGVCLLPSFDDVPADAGHANSVTEFGNSYVGLGSSVDNHSGGGNIRVNVATQNYVLWAFQAGFEQGLDIVDYTGNGANRTVNHNLQAVPEIIFVKRMDATTGSIMVYSKHAAASNPAQVYVPFTDADVVDDNTVWNDTEPTATVFSLGSHANVNANTVPYRAFLFTPKSGVSAFGRYIGNGASQHISLPFSPRLLIIKRVGVFAGTFNWQFMDSLRGATKRIRLTAFASETDDGADGITSLVDGFTTGLRDVLNGNGGEYQYMAWA